MASFCLVDGKAKKAIDEWLAQAQVRAWEEEGEEKFECATRIRTMTQAPCWVFSFSNFCHGIHHYWSKDRNREWLWLLDLIDTYRLNFDDLFGENGHFPCFWIWNSPFMERALKIILPECPVQFPHSRLLRSWIKLELNWSTATIRWHQNSIDTVPQTGA